MKKSSKVYLAAAVCIGVGIVFTAGGIMAGGWPGVAVNSHGIRMLGDRREEYILEKTKLSDFTSADIHLRYGDFSVIPSDDYYLEYCLNGDGREPEYEIEDETFVFEEAPAASEGFQIMSFGISDMRRSHYMNLYVPEDVYFENFDLNHEYGDVQAEKLKGTSIKLNLDYGDLYAGTIQGEKAEVNLTYGTMDAEEITGSQKLEISMNYGDLTVENLNAPENGSVNLENGNASLVSCTAGNMTIDLEYGDLKVQMIKGDNLNIENKSGDVTLGELALEKKGTISLEYGNAKMGLSGILEEFTLNLNTDYGEIHVPGTGRFEHETDEKNFYQQGTGDKILTVSLSSGDITIS